MDTVMFSESHIQYNDANRERFIGDTNDNLS